MMDNIKRGDIVMVDLQGAMFNEQSNERPALVVQNNTGNKFSPTTIVIPLTSELKKIGQPTHAVIRRKDATGLKVDSMALCEQVRTIDKRRIKFKIGKVDSDLVMTNVFKAYMASFGEI